MINTLSFRLPCTLATAFICVASAGAQGQTAFPDDAKNLCAFSQSDFDSRMARINLPTPGAGTEIGPFYDSASGIVYVFPPAGPAFSPVGDCDFFEWGAQLFLWATSTVSDSGTVPTTPSVPSSSTPYVFNSEFFYRYSDGSLIPQTADGPGSAHSLALRTTKAVVMPSAEDGVGQAGGGGVLLSQGSNLASDSESLVYYGVHTSRVMGYVAASNLVVPGTYDEFPNDAASVCAAIKYGMDNGYARPGAASLYLYGLFCPSNTPSVAADQQAPPAAPGFTIPDLEPAIDFLGMTVELKTSWVLAASLADKDQYILQTATVPTYTPATDGNGASYWQATGAQVQELALVGMHVVGTVKGHPEMVWATIEHLNNAPNADYYYLNASDEIVQHAAAFGNSASSGANSPWLFSDGTANAANTERAVLCSNDIQNICSEPAESIGPSNVVRINPWGVQPATQSGPATISSELISLNANVFGVLREFNRAAGIPADPRENYFVSGANWGIDGAVPTLFPNNVAGSVYLANTTMETFMQDIGCFACHSAQSSGGIPPDLTTSHIFSHINNVQKLAGD